jgi:5-methylcytosine-specific restriction protein B
MNKKTKEHIKYIFETNLDNIDKTKLSQNKGLSALCLLYKSKLSHQEISEKYGDNVQFNNINTASVPEFIKEISKYCDVKLINNDSNINEENNLPNIQLFYDDLDFIHSFIKKTEDAGLIFSHQLIQRFIASLCTKPFVICSGLSGSGKTKLAQAFSQWITADKSQYIIIPVGADWTNREPLLGYPNALSQNEYVSPENGVLDLMIRAKQNIENNDEPTKPFFLILDEMNLSHVERYFADFLSTMESGDKIPLHKIENELKQIPQEINLPKNLFIIGTVNIDETTYMFSPKVLDRANTIEFRLTEKDLYDFIESDVPLKMELLTSQGANMSESFMKMALQETDKNLKTTAKDLKDFFTELKKSGAEFGYRTASEIGRLMYMLKELGEDGDNLLDIAIMQKLLPKLHGSRSKLNTALTTLAKFCVKDAIKDFDGKDDEFRKTYFIPYDKLSKDLLDKIKYKISFEKILRMHKNAIENGFTSYAEA